MTRLPMVNAQRVVGALKRAGFEKVYYRGSHLYLHNSKKNVETCVPMHSGDLGRGLVRAILQQAGLTANEFQELL